MSKKRSKQYRAARAAKRVGRYEHSLEVIKENEIMAYRQDKEEYRQQLSMLVMAMLIAGKEDAPDILISRAERLQGQLNDAVQQKFPIQE